MERITARRVAALVVAGLLSVVPAESVGGAEKIKITVPAAVTTFAPLYHARAAGYFADEGLDVEVVVIPGPASLQAVIAGDAQFALIPGTYQLMAHDKGQRLPAVMSILTRNSINIVMHKDVARAKGITDKSPLAEKIKALKGLKLAGSTRAAFPTRCSFTTCSRPGSIPKRTSNSSGSGATRHGWPRSSNARSMRWRPRRRRPKPPSLVASA